MPLTVSITIDKGFETPAAPEKVFSVLSDVRRSASFFPRVERIIDEGDNVYRWELQKISLGSYTMEQTVYASRYLADPASLKITWTPVPEVGNALVEGEWVLTPKAGGTVVTLKSKGEITLDFPAILQIIIAPLVQFEFSDLMERYLAHLKESFSTL
ncbi:MAG: SRPBCC family protein [Chlorobiaceae bacterium]